MWPHTATWDTRFAGDVIYKETAYIDLTENYNGSGPRGFGGAKKWPVVEIHFPFPADREDLAKKLLDELSELISGFITEHGLDLEK